MNVSEADLPATASADQLQSTIATIDMPVLVNILALSGPPQGFYDLGA